MTSSVATAQLPADIGVAIRAAKAKLRRQLGDVAGAFAVADRSLRAEVESVIAIRDAGQPVWPVVEFEAIATSSVPAQVTDAIRRRGCVVVRGTFSRKQARDWDAELPTPIGTASGSAIAPSMMASSAAWLTASRRSTRFTGRCLRSRPGKIRQWRWFGAF
jgi:hypothetical protein